MSTAQQYREKANEYEGLLGSAHSPGGAIELRELMQSYLAPVENMDSLTANRDKTTWPRTKHRDNHVAPADKEKFLRYLGAAVIMRWHTIPTKLQRELFEHASTLDELQLPPWRAALTQFLHDRKDDEKRANRMSTFGGFLSGSCRRDVATGDQYGQHCDAQIQRWAVGQSHLEGGALGGGRRI
jgi:hypothetical protein